MFHVDRAFSDERRPSRRHGDRRSEAASGQGRRRTALSESEAEAAFDIIMTGNATPAQMGALPDGAAGARRDRRRDHRRGADRCAPRRSRSTRRRARSTPVGTGGDALRHASTSRPPARWSSPAAACRSPSTATARCSSKSGAADVLTALGVNIDADLAVVRRCLWEIGIGFLMAPRHHSAMRHVAPTRVELGTRTIFNLLGPMSNPAGARRQLVGVFAPEWVAADGRGAGPARRRARLGRARRRASTS